jgi:hypothetical protein
MCCFFPHVEDIADTNIFCRFANGKQIVVYQMKYESDTPVAMVLPIPVDQAKNSEKAVEFINLEKYEDFFDDIYSPFQLRTKSFGSRGLDTDSFSLEVHNVGNFEASYAPTLDDLSRLDPKFGMDISVWNKIPQYKDYGFVVFKLKSGNVKPHPMAFNFPSRLSSKLFFPTVHIHDGEVHQKEKFDHRLFAQGTLSQKVSVWETAPAAKNYIKPKGDIVVNREESVHYLSMKGNLANEDVLLEV